MNLPPRMQELRMWATRLHLYGGKEEMALLSAANQMIAGLPIPVDQMPAEEQMMLLGGPPPSYKSSKGMNTGVSSQLAPLSLGKAGAGAGSEGGGGVAGGVDEGSRIVPQLYTGANLWLLQFTSIHSYLTTTSLSHINHQHSKSPPLCFSSIFYSQSSHFFSTFHATSSAVSELHIFN